MCRVALAASSLAAVVLLGAACGGGETQPLPTPSATAPPTADAPAGRTGWAAVDGVIEAVEAGDTEAVVSLVHFTDVPCIATPPPVAVEVVRCLPGQPEGSPVKAFLSIACEGATMVEASDGVDELRSEVRSADHRVYAVYRIPEGRRFGGEGFPRLQHAVMLTYSREEGPVGVALLVGPDGLVGIDRDCGFPPDQMAELEDFGEAILPPSEPPGTRP